MGVCRQASRNTSDTSQTQAEDRPLSGTGDERRRSERQPDVVERKGEGEERAQQVRHHQEDESGLDKDFHDGLAEEARNPLCFPAFLLSVFLFTFFHLSNEQQAEHQQEDHGKPAPLRGKRG